MGGGAVYGPFINKTLAFAFQRVSSTHSSRTTCLPQRSVVLPLERLEKTFLILSLAKSF